MTACIASTTAATSDMPAGNTAGADASGRGPEYAKQIPMNPTNASALRRLLMVCVPLALRTPCHCRSTKRTSTAHAVGLTRALPLPTSTATDSPITIEAAVALVQEEIQSV